MIDLDELEKLCKQTTDFPKFTGAEMRILISEIRKLREANGVMSDCLTQLRTGFNECDSCRAIAQAAKIMGGEVKTEASYLADLFNNIPECDDLFHVFGPGDSGKSKCRCGLTYSDGKYARSLSQRNYTEDT